MTIDFTNGHTGQTDRIYWTPWVRKIVWLPNGQFLGLSHELHRYNADDTMDRSFGTVIPPMPRAGLGGATLLADGKTLVFGSYTPSLSNLQDSAFYAYRINPDGSLDSSYGGGKGWVGADFGRANDLQVDFSVQRDGKVILLGTSWDTTPDVSGQVPYDPRIVMVRLTVDGKIDTSFANQGYLKSDVPASAPLDMVAQADGKMVIASMVRMASGFDFLRLFRFNPDGSIDKSYGTNGVAYADLPQNANSNVFTGKLALQADGKVVVLFNVLMDTAQFAYSTGVLRFDATGRLDTSFGNAGVAINSLALSDGTAASNLPFDLLIQDNGRILIGTDVMHGTPAGIRSQIGILALRPDGSIDTTWGQGGSYLGDFGSRAEARGDGIFVRPDGSLFIKGSMLPFGSNQGISNSFSLNADGTVDQHFGAVDNSLQNAIAYNSRHAAEALNSHIELQLSGTARIIGAGLTLQRHGGASASDQFFASPVIDGVRIGDLSMADGVLRITFNADATTALINKFLQSVKYSFAGDVSTPQDIVIDWLYNDGKEQAAFGTKIALAPGGQPYWIDKLLAHTAAGQSNEQLKELFNSYVGEDKTIDVAYVTGPGGVPFSSESIVKLRSLLSQLASTVDLRIGSDAAIGSDTLVFHSSGELAAGATAYTAPSKAGASVLFKPDAGGIDALMDSIHGRLAQALGLQGDPAALDPFGQLETAALQYLYGPSKTARVGNDSYGLSTDAANFLWDGAGSDSIDGSALTQDLTLHLEAGHWDFIGSKGAAITDAGQITINYGSVFENAIGGSGNDQLSGTAGANILRGGAGSDMLAGNGGGDLLDGGSGIDTAVYSWKLADYTIAHSGSATTVTGPGGKDSLTAVERLHFADADIAIDIDGNAGQLYRLYQAIFNRQPDLAGLGWWLDAVDRGVSLESVAESFTQSREFATMYGANASNTVLLTKIYEFALHRMPDKEGFAWWLDILDNHKASLGSVLMGFSESQENYAQVIGSIQHGIAYTPFHD
jgi:uncharacterized delta-60 repeat protein